MSGLCSIYNLFPSQKKDSSVLENPRRIKLMGDLLHHRGDKKAIFFIPHVVGMDVQSYCRDKGEIYSDRESDLRLIYSGTITNTRQLKGEISHLKSGFLKLSAGAILISMYKKYGDDFVSRLSGMFSIILWDKKNNRLLAYRDISGTKNLYYACMNGYLYLATELKAIRGVANISKDFNLSSLKNFFIYGYSLSEETLFKDIHQVKPGTYLYASEKGVMQKTYYNLRTNAYFHSLPSDIHKKIYSLIEKGVEGHLGNAKNASLAFSGGVDSCILAYILSKKMGIKLSSWHCVFKEDLYNPERKRAQAIATQLGMSFREVDVHDDYFDQLEKILFPFDNPSADPAIIPIYALSLNLQKSGEGKDVFYGLGADVIFGGMSAYRGVVASQYYNALFSKKIRNCIALLLEKVPTRSWPLSKMFLLKHFIKGAQDDFPHSLQSWYAAFNKKELNLLMNIHCSEEQEDDDSFLELIKHGGKEYGYENMLKAEFIRNAPAFLTDSLNALFGIETHYPFVDNELVYYLHQIPFRYKVKLFNGKKLLRDVIRPYIPRTFISQKKCGFSVPVGEWMRDRQKSKVEALILHGGYLKLGFFNKSYIREVLDEFNMGRDEHAFKVWTLVCFSVWYNLFYGR